MIKIGLVIVFAMWMIMMCIAPFWEDIKYWFEMRKLNKQFPCQTCENSDCVSNNSPCYSCYYKSEYKDREEEAKKEQDAINKAADAMTRCQNCIHSFSTSIEEVEKGIGSLKEILKDKDDES